LAQQLPGLLAGVYRHYKGGLYQVVGYGHDANYPGRDVVLYIPLYTDPEKPGPRWCVRDVEVSDESHPTHQPGPFFDEIYSPGLVVPRFEYVSPGLSPS